MAKIRGNKTKLSYRVFATEAKCLQNTIFRMKRHLVLVLFSLSIGTAFSVTPEDCEDSEFHLDPDDCPSSYFRCYSEANVSKLGTKIAVYE